MKRSKEWLILNAVKGCLYQYQDKEEVELTPQYNELHKELYNAYITKDNPVQKRGRPAKRQRKKETASFASGEKES